MGLLWRDVSLDDPNTRCGPRYKLLDPSYAFGKLSLILWIVWYDTNVCLRFKQNIYTQFSYQIVTYAVFGFLLRTVVSL